MSLSIGNYYKLLEFIKDEDASDEQMTLRKKWLS